LNIETLIKSGGGKGPCEARQPVMSCKRTLRWC